MSKKYESYITVFEDTNWRGDSLGSSFPLYVDSESLDAGKQIINNNNLIRDGRVNKQESQVSGPIKPEGVITFQPRVDDIGAVLYSHFQLLQESGTGPYSYIYNPSKYPPRFNDSSSSSEGTYGSEPQAVYSVSFLKKCFDTTENGGTNSMLFKHGVCDSLSLNVGAGEDVKLECNYKFRDLIDGTAISDNPPSSHVGSYSENAPFEWYHGTVTIDGVDFSIESINLRSVNSLEEKSILGRREPDSFIFKEYLVEGQFSLDFPKDGMLQIGSMFDLSEFSISGTLFQGTSNKITFEVPNCIRQPFNVGLNEDTVTATIPFKGFEKDGTSPFTVRVTSDVNFKFTGEALDAVNGARTIADHEILDAGTGSRNLSEYTIYDRELI